MRTTTLLALAMTTWACGPALSDDESASETPTLNGTSGIQYTFDVGEGLGLVANPQAQRAGFFSLLSFGGVPLEADLEAYEAQLSSDDPTASPSVAVMESVSWAGGRGDPISWVTRMSPENRDRIASAVQGGSVLVEAEWKVYVAQDDAHFVAFATTAAAQAIVQQRAGELQLVLSPDANVDIAGSENVTVSFSLLPQSPTTLTTATASDQVTTRSWGVAQTP